MYILSFSISMEPWPFKNIVNSPPIPGVKTCRNISCLKTDFWFYVILCFENYFLTLFCVLVSRLKTFNQVNLGEKCTYFLRYYRLLIRTGCYHLWFDCKKCFARVKTTRVTDRIRNQIFTIKIWERFALFYAGCTTLVGIYFRYHKYEKPRTIILKSDNL